MQIQKTFILNNRDMWRYVWFIYYRKSVLFIPVIAISASPSSPYSIENFPYGWLTVFLLVLCTQLYILRAGSRRFDRSLPWSIIVNDYGIEWISPNKTKAFFPWDILSRSHVNKRYFFILTSFSSAIMIPKAALTAEEVQTFSEILHKHDIRSKDRWVKIGVIIFVLLAVVGIIDALT